MGPWSLQLFVDPWSLQLFVDPWSLKLRVFADPWSLWLFISGFDNNIPWYLVICKFLIPTTKLYSQSY